MSRLGVGHPLAGDSFLLDPIAAVLIGGTSMAGGEGGAVDTLVGVLIMGVLNNGLYLIAIDAFSITLIKGLIIIGAVATIALRKRRRG
jgi:ribose transport system permease protein